MVEDILGIYDSNQDRHCPFSSWHWHFHGEIDKENDQQAKSLQILISTTKEIAWQDKISRYSNEERSLRGEAILAEIGGNKRDKEWFRQGEQWPWNRKELEDGQGVWV